MKEKASQCFGGKKVVGDIQQKRGRNFQNFKLYRIAPVPPSVGNPGL